MIKLIGNAKLERIRGTDTWRLVEDFIVFLTDGRKIIIPHGFITDKASVPRVVWWLIPRDDKHIVDGALVHDYLYATQQIKGKWISRKEADQILLAICKHVGMNWFKRPIVRSGVRLGGWHKFNKVASNLDNPLV